MSFNWLSDSWTCGFELVTRGFEVMTQEFELAIGGFELVNCRFELVTRKVELVACEFEPEDSNSYLVDLTSHFLMSTRALKLFTHN